MAPLAPTGSRRRFRLAAVLLPVVMLLALEGLLRVGGFEHPLDSAAYVFVSPDRDVAVEGSPTIPDPVLFWKLRAGASTPDGKMSVAPSGFRTDFETTKAAGTFRVMCLGDSSTYGLHVSAEQAWPARLEKLLEPGSEPVEVLNLGVPGYTSHQGRVLLEMRGAELQPDVIVAAFGAFNDWVPARLRTDAEQREPPAWRRLRVVQLGAMAIGRAPAEALSEESKSTTETLDELATFDYSGLRRVPLPDFEANLRAIHRVATDLGATLVLVAEPLRDDTLRRNPIASEYHAAGKRIAADLGVPFADGWPRFAAEGAEPPLFEDFCHPSPRGHELLAEAVFAALNAE